MSTGTCRDCGDEDVYLVSGDLCDSCSNGVLGLILFGLG